MHIRAKRQDKKRRRKEELLTESEVSEPRRSQWHQTWGSRAESFHKLEVVKSFQLTHSQNFKPVSGERRRAGGEGGDRGRDGWMASPTQQT